MRLAKLKEIVDELIEDGHGELDVIMSKDAEGNGFSSLYELFISHCYDNEPIHPNDIGTEYDEEDIERKIVMYPV